MDPLDPRQDGGSFDGERVEEDDEPALPESTRDDTDAGWGERSGSNDDWLIEERPPHWDHP